MHKDTQSILLRNASILSALSLETDKDADMSVTIEQLEGYVTSLALVTDAELRPFAQKAKSLVIATLRYLKNRSTANLTKAQQLRDVLSDAMLSHKQKG